MLPNGQQIFAYGRKKYKAGTAIGSETPKVRDPRQLERTLDILARAILQNDCVLGSSLPL
jgi:hypothetical protein